MVKRNRMNDNVLDTVIIIILTGATLLCLMPLIHTLALSFSDKTAAGSGNVYFWPVKFNLSSYHIILQDASFFRAFAISVQRVILGCSINFILTVLLAFSLSREPRQFPGRNIYMWILIFTMLFNGGLVPLYLTITKLRILDTIWALVFPTAVPVFNVILLMNFFKGVPKELEEAALIDGAGPWHVLIKVFIPVSIPALATITLFQVVFHWNSFFDGLIYMNNPKNYPLQTYIRQLVVVIRDMNQTLSLDELKRLQEVSNDTLNSAKIIVSMIPVLLIYPFLQRYFITGIVLGSVKG